MRRRKVWAARRSVAAEVRARFSISIKQRVLETELKNEQTADESEIAKSNFAVVWAHSSTFYRPRPTTGRARHAVCDLFAQCGPARLARACGGSLKRLLLIRQERRAEKGTARFDILSH
jgi:hypothetical protein